jgi:hypothetical protein
MFGPVVTVAATPTDDGHKLVARDVRGLVVWMMEGDRAAMRELIAETPDHNGHPLALVVLDHLED